MFALFILLIVFTQVLIHILSQKVSLFFLNFIQLGLELLDGLFKTLLILF